MGLIFLILIVFSSIWLLVWLWFFSTEKNRTENAYKAGETAIELGDYEKAKELLLQVKDAKNAPDVNYKLGLVYLNLKEYDEARLCFEQNLKASPKNFDAMFNLAEILQMQNKNDEALKLYEDALEGNKENIECYLNIARLYSKQGNHEKALDMLKGAKTIAPDNVLILFAIAKSKGELCDPDNIEVYQAIIDEYIQLVGITQLPEGFDISLAILYAKSGQIDKALEYCQNAINANDEDIEAYKLLGLIKLIQKNYSEAKNNLSIVLNFQPNNVEAHNIFSYLLCGNGDDCAIKKCRNNYFKLIKKYLEE